MNYKIKKQNLLNIIEKKYTREANFLKTPISIGTIVEISYKIPEGEKERIQKYEGLIIAKKNKSIGKTITLRRTVEGIGVEQIFFLNSPKIQNIEKKESIKVRKSKLYYLRK